MKKDSPRLFVSIFCSFLGLVLLILINCGGGSSSSPPPPPPPNYSGTWSFSGAMYYNDCQLSGFSNTFSATNKVTHSGNNVVLVSGTVTLTGTTHDKYGFEVYSPITTDSNGCRSQAGYRYEGASDGNANAAFAIVAQCGKTQCGLGYGGTAVRTSLSTALSIETESDSTLDLLMNKCIHQIFEKKPDSSKESLPLDEEGLKAAVTDVVKSAISEKTKDGTNR